MRRAATFLAVFIFGVGLAWVYDDATQASANTCTAPCTVNFNGPMAEDNFNLDYQAPGVVKVFREMPCDHFCFEIHAQRGTCPIEPVKLTDPGDIWPERCKN